MKYKDYYNFELGNRDIYSRNDILGMTVQDLFDQELPLSYQYNTIGIPKDDELMNSPNTHQYTNANGALRWRSSSKTTEELLEEERQRNQELQAQTQSVQSQLGNMTGGAKPIQNVPKQQVESPMMESEPLLNEASVQALAGLINKAKDKIQANREANTAAEAELHDLVFGSPEDYPEETLPETNVDKAPESTSSPNFIQRFGKNLKNGIQNIFEGVNEDITGTLLESFRSDSPDVKNYLIDPNKANVVLQENPNAYLMEEISNNNRKQVLPIFDNTTLTPKVDNQDSDYSVEDFNNDYYLSGQVEKSNVKENVKDFMREHSKIYRDYENLTPTEAMQKWTSKFFTHFTGREYYGLSSELKDDGKPAKKRLRDNDFYKLSDIQDAELRSMMEKNIVKNLKLDPNDPVTYEKIKNMDIVVPKSTSTLQKQLKNSENMADYIAENYEKLKANPGQRTYGSTTFERPDIKRGIFHPLKATDEGALFSVLNKADRSSKVNEDGSMDILINDLYDFDYIDPNKKSTQGKFYAAINNNAYYQQQMGQLQKYGLSIPIHLTKEEVDAILNKRANPSAYEMFLKKKGLGLRN